MIHRSIHAVEVDNDSSATDWKSLLRSCRITTRALLERLELTHHPLADAAAEELFELRVPGPYLDLIKTGDANDPLLLQILPQAREFERVSGFAADPLLEREYSPVAGLIHKYHNRVLLITAQACAIHCRYCFRRHFPYSEHRQSKSDWQAALSYIADRPEIDEVILSGGDPLVLDNDYLGWLLQQLAAIEHVHTLRIHSRLASTLPQRIDAELLAQFKALQKPVVMNLHCNHPNEISPRLAQAIAEMRQAGVTVLNQSVLLRHVNDDAQTLAALSRRLFQAGALPYYLFTLDKVEGAAHFDVSLNEARDIYQSLASQVSGYLLPRLMSEIPGRAAKSAVHVETKCV